MKKGDIVTIQDTSYMRSVVNGELVYPGHLLRYKQCKVIEVGCTFPRTSIWDGNNVNNTIIQVYETDQIIFIEERFLTLVLPKHKIMIDITYDDCAMFGETVEISDKLYQEIKRES